MVRNSSFQPGHRRLSWQESKAVQSARLKAVQKDEGKSRGEQNVLIAFPVLQKSRVDLVLERK